MALGIFTHSRGRGARLERRLSLVLPQTQERVLREPNSASSGVTAQGRHAAFISLGRSPPTSDALRHTEPLLPGEALPLLREMSRRVYVLIGGKIGRV